ncbi:MAG: hypothetical protein HXL35_07000 [Prevotellaceae bacterium]|nr:hypothetical protein [Prevotellaceae bacterium]
MPESNKSIQVYPFCQTLTPFLQHHCQVKTLSLHRIYHCTTAASSAYGDRRTTGVTAVNSAAGGRRTTNILP